MDVVLKNIEWKEKKCQTLIKRKLSHKVWKSQLDLAESRIDRTYPTVCLLKQLSGLLGYIDLREYRFLIILRTSFRAHTQKKKEKKIQTDVAGIRTRLHLLPRQSLTPIDHHGDCQYLVTKPSVRCICQTSVLYVMKHFANIFLVQAIRHNI